MIWRILILFLSYWLLAAHFLRFGHAAITAVLAIVPLVVFLKRRAIIRLLQLGLVIGVVGVWLPTLYNIAVLRASMGEPWLRMALILFAVCVFNLISAWAITPIHQRK